MRRFRKYIIILFIITGTYVTILNIFNDFGPVRKNIYLARKTGVYPAVGNDIRLKVKYKGQDVYGLFSQNGKKLVVLCHGNGALINDFAGIAGIFYKNGFSTLLVEYPGFGLAYGKLPTERKIYSQTEALMAYVQKTYGFKKEDTCLLGWSLGGAVAAEMVRRGKGNKLMIISTFTSVPDLVHQKIVPILPYLLILDHFNNKRKASSIDVPVLVLHGKKDRLIPYQMSVKLDSIFKDSELLLFERADHVDIFRFIDTKTWQKIFQFFKL